MPLPPQPNRQPAQPRKHPIDRTMERASASLERMDYFLAERLALESLHRAHQANDYERMSRIVLPLLEARRQKRQLATECASEQHAEIVESLSFVEGDPMPGCYLFQPPLIGADAVRYREAANAADTPVFLLTREPLTRDGLWPIVSVGAVVIRTRLLPPQSPSPPWPPQRVDSVMTRDDVRPGIHRVPLQWFEAAAEALGDSAIARLKPDDPAAWQVADLMEFLDAFPDHEKLHQRLEDACHRAMHEEVPETPRRRPVVDDPFSF